MAAAQVALTWSGLALAQTEPTPAAAAAAAAASAPTPASAAASAPTPAAAAASAPARAGAAPQTLDAVVISGQRAALQSAQKLKQNAEEIVDSVVAEEAGKLPDKSITEVLQRLVGVTIDRNRSRGDPEHFSVEGSGISIRGLTWGASTLNGRESFSAGWPGRELSWGDVPPELMAGVDVYKNPSAEIIEGGVSGVVNLRTHLPFDFKGTKGYISLGNNYVALSGKNSPNVSGLYTTQWDAESGRWGVLVDVSMNRSSFSNDSLQLDAYYPRTDLVPGQTVWVPKAASYRRNTGENERAGLYAALQWKKNEMKSALTYFLSDSRSTGTEQGVYSALESPYKTAISNAVYDANGVLQSGTYTYPGGRGSNLFVDGGLNYAVSRGWNRTNAKTGELAWNFQWEINDRWAFQNDIQWVHATNDSLSGNIQLGTFVPSVSIDASGTAPVRLGFDQAATEFLANPENYYWNLVMPGMSRAKADLYAWKADAKFSFDDPVLRDFRFGTRLTYRKAMKEDASFTSRPDGTAGWTSIAEPWSVITTPTPGQLPTAYPPGFYPNQANFAYMRDPRYTTVPVELFDYRNFYSGAVGRLPDIVMPTIGSVRDFENVYSTLLTDYRYQRCRDSATQLGGNPDSCNLSDFVVDATMQYGLNPAAARDHSEQTQALYGTLRFGFDDWKVPVEGNVGVRVVHTSDVAHGRVTFNRDYTNAPPDLPRFPTLADPLHVSNSYTDVLPSLNLKADLAKNLQARLAMAQAVHRPGFDKLQEYVRLKQDYNQDNNTVTYTGENDGNGRLKPIKANSYDVSLEWYPRDGQSLTGGVFYKEVKDIIMNTTFTRTFNSVAGNPQIFAITGPDNVAEARVGGIEIAGMTYLDRVSFLDGKLPDWAKGLGVAANYTYIDAKQQLYKPYFTQYCNAGRDATNGVLNTYGCDTNGIPFNDLPLPYLAKNALNFTLMYDRGPLSARLAYNWHSRIFQGVNVNGTRGEDAISADPARNGAQDVGWALPTWQEAFGQWDAGVSYKVNDQLSVSLNVTNLNDVIVRQTQQQHIGNMGRAWFKPGRSYAMSARYEF